MKQHDIHNDDALYQQMLAELAPGAEEYDKLMAEGKHPAAKKRRVIPYYKYAVAASVLLAIGGGALLMTEQEADEPLSEPVAIIAEQQPTQQPDVLLTQEAAQPSAPQRKEASAPQHPITAAEPLQAESPATTAPDTDGCDPVELQLALLNEIEYRAALAQLQDEYLHRALIEELTNHIIEQPEGPQLTL